MTGEIIRDLVQMQQFARGIQELLAAAQRGAPARSEGEDRTGSVNVTLGADGLPDSFRIRQGWSRRIAADKFGAAVMEAAEEAMSARMAAWAQDLREQGWEDKADQLRCGDQELSGETSVDFRGPTGGRHGRSIGEITEDMIVALDGAMAVEPSAFKASDKTGVGTSGKLSLTLSASQLVSCIAEPDWVAGQTAARLMNALAGALAKARANLAGNVSASKSGGGLENLLEEAFFMLRDPRRVMDS